MFSDMFIVLKARVTAGGSRPLVFAVDLGQCHFVPSDATGIPYLTLHI